MTSLRREQSVTTAAALDAASVSDSSGVGVDDPVGSPGSRRLVGLDVLRGLAIVGMLFVDNRGNAHIGQQWIHAPWNGLRVADVVFPLFLFAVGTSMAMSRRSARPGAVLSRFAKLLLIGVVLVLLRHGWHWNGGGVLAHVAFAYLIGWLIVRCGPRLQYAAAATILLGVSALFIAVPVPGTAVTGFSESVNWASWLDDVARLGYSDEGPHSYLTSGVSVFIGVIAGRLIKRYGAAAMPRLGLLAGGLAAVGAASAAVVPINKGLWTPSYVLITSAIALVLMIACYLIVDRIGCQWPFRPLLHLGSNAIVAFVLSEILFRTVLDGVRPDIADWIASWSSPTWAAYLYPLGSIAVIWVVCFVLYRRRIVIRV